MSDKIKLPVTKYQRILNILTFLILAGHILCLLLSWSSIPDKVPTHYDFSGKADGYGGKGSLLILPVINVILYAILCLIERYPDTWNVPGPVTPLNQIWIYTNVKNLLVTLKFLTTGIFCFLTIYSAMGKNLSVWFTPAYLILILGSMFYFLRRAKHFH